MARLKPVTDSELEAVLTATVGGYELSSVVYDLVNRLGSNVELPIATPDKRAAEALSISRSFADLASRLLIRHELQTQRAQLEQMKAEVANES